MLALCNEVGRQRRDERKRAKTATTQYLESSNILRLLMQLRDPFLLLAKIISVKKSSVSCSKYKQPFSRVITQLLSHIHHP